MAEWLQFNSLSNHWVSINNHWVSINIYKYLLEDILINTIEGGRRIFLIGMRDSVRRYLHRQGVTSLFKPGKIYDKRLDALIHAKTLLQEMAELSD